VSRSFYFGCHGPAEHALDGCDVGVVEVKRCRVRAERLSASGGHGASEDPDFDGAVVGALGHAASGTLSSSTCVCVRECVCVCVCVCADSSFLSFSSRD
jgi:hypothetical protein